MCSNMRPNEPTDDREAGVISQGRFYDAYSWQQPSGCSPSSIPTSRVAVTCGCKFLLHCRAAACLPQVLSAASSLVSLQRRQPQLMEVQYLCPKTNRIRHFDSLRSAAEAPALSGAAFLAALQVGSQHAPSMEQAQTQRPQKE